MNQRYIERQTTTMGDSERDVEALWDLRDIERQPATIEVSERNAETPWDWERQ